MNQGSLEPLPATAERTIGNSGLRALVRRLTSGTLSETAVEAVLAECTAAEEDRPTDQASGLRPIAERLREILREAATAPRRETPAPLRVRLVDFAATAVRVRMRGEEAEIRRLLASPFSGCERADVSIVLRLAAREGGVRETIERGRIVMPPQSAHALRRFSDSIVAFIASPAESARDLVCAVVSRFHLALREDERTTLRRLEETAQDLDLAAELLPAADRDIARELLLALSHLAADSCIPGTEAGALVLQPLAPRLPEHAERVPRRAMTFSASALAAYAECERKWYFRYLCGAVEDPGSSASFYGSAFHDALENFHKKRVRSDEAPAELLVRELRAWITTAFERYRTKFPTAVEFELQRRRASRTAVRYIDWFVLAGRKRPFTVMGTETHERIDLGGYPFVGYVDRLDRDDVGAAVSVLDYKTGAVAMSAAEYRADVAAFLDFQLPFYYWARTALGERVARLLLVPLKESTLDVVPIELEVVPVALPAGRDTAPSGVIGIDELRRARERMIELARTLTDGDQRCFPATEDPRACEYCAYREACRDRPAAREDPFGR